MSVLLHKVNGDLSVECIHEHEQLNMIKKSIQKVLAWMTLKCIFWTLVSY